MTGIHNQPHFHNHPDAVYSRIVYSSKSSDVTHVICNGRWLMRDRELLTVDESAARLDAIEVAKAIDAFVIRRESSPYNKLVLLSGVQRQESFEVQVKCRWKTTRPCACCWTATPNHHSLCPLPAIRPLLSVR